MEIEQPDKTDLEAPLTAGDEAKPNRRSKRRARPHHHAEATVSLDGTMEHEIPLHPDAHQLHTRVEEGRDDEEPGRPDPAWEPWHAPAEAEQAVKDLAVPAAEIHATSQIDNNLAPPLPPERPEVPPAPPQPSALEVEPEPAQQTPNQPPSLPFSRPEFSQVGINPNLTESENMSNLQADAQRTVREEHAAQPWLAPQTELPKEAQDIMQRLQMPDSGSHLEQSAWHNIEVDNKTGQAVENPSFAYGEEFRHEQQPEAAPQNPEEAEVATASGQLAVATTGTSSVNPNEPPAGSPLSSREDESETHYAPRRASPSVPRLGSSMADPLLWIIFIVIVIAIVFAVVL